jgi:hypothetical protein
MPATNATGPGRTLRCRQTLLPLAAARRLELQPVDALGVDGDVDHLAGLLTAPGSGGTVWCTHGEVLGSLLARLHRRGIIHPDHPAGIDGGLRYEKGSAWLLEGRPTGGFHARYLPPRAPAWVPGIRSVHATCAYSWISPPSRSRRTTLPSSARTAGSLG